MATPLQTRALRAIKARLEQIAIADGYQTNAGERVYLGPRWPDERDVPCIILIDGGDESVPDSGGKDTNNGNSRSMHLQQTFIVDVFAQRYEDIEEGGIGASEVKADAKTAALDYDAQALSDDDGTIGGPLTYQGAVPIEAPDGSNVEGFRLTFTHKVLEAYGDATRTR